MIWENLRSRVADDRTGTALGTPRGTNAGTGVGALRSHRIRQHHLELRPSGFFWRRRWPRSAIGRTPSGKSFLVFPLRTHLPGDAKILAGRLTAISDQVFAALEWKTVPIAPETAEAILTMLVRFRIDAAEAAREVAPFRTAAVAAAEAEHYLVEQEVLREALALRKREVAAQPLQRVLQHLGVAVDPAELDYQRLAMKALRVLFDSSVECQRRDQGLFSAPSREFRIALRDVDGFDAPTAIATPASPIQTRPSVVPSLQASDVPPRDQPPSLGSRPEPHPDCQRSVMVPSDAQVLPIVTVSSSVQSSPLPLAAFQPRADVKVQEAFPEGATVPKQSAAPETQSAGKAAEPKSRAKPEEMGLAAWFDFYIARMSSGHTPGGNAEETPDSGVGEKWLKTSKNNMEVAKRLWVSLLGDRPPSDMSSQEIKDAIALLKKLPDQHGKSCAETRDIRALVAETDAREAKQIADAKITAKWSDMSEAQKEMLFLEAKIPRIRTETIVKHVRALNKPGKMLVNLERVEKNPFERHMLSSRMIEAMQAQEEDRARRPWDDRFQKLLATPVFQGKLDDVGDPMFWAPLMSYLGGGREEEILQLRPKDFEQHGGKNFYRIQRGGGNSVKSEAGGRLIPVHPELERLGLMRLVELRRAENQPRLFPNLKRGKAKETFTEIFTKRFNRYRHENRCYWVGLDFHALRTTFHHKLMGLLTPGYVKRALMGHEGLDEGEKSYAQDGIPPLALYDIVSRIPCDLSSVWSPLPGDVVEDFRYGLRVVR